MKLFISAALAAITPFALGQTINQISPVKATATNTITGKNTANAPKPGTPKPSKPPTKKPTPSKPSGSANANQNQNANSNANANSTNSAAIGQGGKSASNSTASGGAGGLGVGSATSSAAGGQSSANGTNSVDASDRSVNNSSFRETFIPAIVPPTPPSTVAVGNVVVETSECGPLQSIVKIPVDGTFYGLVKKSKTPLGFTEELAPYTDENGQVQEYRRVETEDGYALFGHQVVQYTAILGVAGARNIALGGGGSSGSWAQGGLGSSSSNQRLVTTITLRSCEVARVKREVVPPVVADVLPPQQPVTPDFDQYVFQEDLAPVKHKPVQSHRHKAKHNPAGPCVSLTVK